MQKTWKLKRTTQCVKCPWRVVTNPRTIPNGYAEAKHRALRSTIAEPELLQVDVMNVFACHETDEAHCIG